VSPGALGSSCKDACCQPGVSTREKKNTHKQRLCLLAGKESSDRRPLKPWSHLLLEGSAAEAAACKLIHLLSDVYLD